MSEKKSGYATATYKLRLYDRHHDWLVYTKQLYNQVVRHYYQILTEETELLEQTNFLLLRKLEEMTIGTKEMKARSEEPVKKLAGFPKIPLYFRRAAINTAIGTARIKKVQQQFHQEIEYNFSPTFYKGMYREFTDKSVQLKVYNGEKWVWVTFPFAGRSIPKNAQILSPILYLEKRNAYLHVPAVTSVADIRSVKERMKEEKAVCAVSFPDSDTLAVCVIMQTDGSVSKSYFIHGGKMREEQRKAVLKKIKKSKDSRGYETGGQTGEERENKALYQKLEQINCHYAHRVSSEILKYCIRNEIKIIVVPNYENNLNFQTKQYLNTDSFHWQGRAIIRKLKQKAFKQGILVTTIRPYHISDSCSECGERIQKYNEGHKAGRNYYGGQLFFCPNGHKGNTALNTAKNIGRKFLQHYQNEQDIY